MASHITKVEARVEFIKVLPLFLFYACKSVCINMMYLFEQNSELHVKESLNCLWIYWHDNCYLILPALIIACANPYFPSDVCHTSHYDE